MSETSRNSSASPEVVRDLAASGTLRAAINMSNFLLVTGRTRSGEPEGVSPDMARELARQLGVRLELLPYGTPGEIADDAGTGVWDIANIGTEPKRAEKIDFTAAYCEIQATYLVPAGSRIKAIEEVDRLGVRVAVSARSAYDLWLERHVRHAELVRAEGLDASLELFVHKGLDALAGLRPRLVSDAEKLPGARILDGQFTAVQQAMGCTRGRHAGAAFLREFVETSKASGFVAGLIAKHGVQGRLSVAPLAQ
ncbi:MAG: transporter substrate-binding domain-containing protein [Alphaproteobacteria bacterium]|nr:transporter substrate-binding domain-containing protein [Alphaproteobacteria bacterium]